MADTEDKRVKEAFDSDELLCATCQLRFREYWSTLAMLNDPGTAPPASFTGIVTHPDRVPMCRSGRPLCDGLEGVLAVRYGRHIARASMQAIVPMLLH